MVSNSYKYLLCVAVVDAQTRSSLAVDIRRTPRNRLQLRNSAGENVGVDGLDLSRVFSVCRLQTTDNRRPLTHAHNTRTSPLAILYTTRHDSSCSAFFYAADDRCSKQTNSRPTLNRIAPASRRVRPSFYGCCCCSWQ